MVEELDTFQTQIKTVNKFDDHVLDSLLTQFKYHFVIRGLPIDGALSDSDSLWESYIQNFYQGFQVNYMGPNSVYIVQIYRVYIQKGTNDIIVGLRRDEHAFKFYRESKIYKYKGKPYQVQLASGFKTYFDYLNLKHQKQRPILLVKHRQQKQYELKKKGSMEMVKAKEDDDKVVNFKVQDKIKNIPTTVVTNKYENHIKYEPQQRQEVKSRFQKVEEIIKLQGNIELSRSTSAITRYGQTSFAQKEFIKPSSSSYYNQKQQHQQSAQHISQNLIINNQSKSSSSATKSKQLLTVKQQRQKLLKQNIQTSRFAIADEKSNRFQRKIQKSRIAKNLYATEREFSNSYVNRRDQQYNKSRKRSKSDSSRSESESKQSQANRKSTVVGNKKNYKGDEYRYVSPQRRLGRDERNERNERVEKFMSKHQMQHSSQKLNNQDLHKKQYSSQKSPESHKKKHYNRYGRYDHNYSHNYNNYERSRSRDRDRQKDRQKGRQRDRGRDLDRKTSKDSRRGSGFKQPTMSRRLSQQSYSQREDSIDNRGRERDREFEREREKIFQKGTIRGRRRGNTRWDQGAVPEASMPSYYHHNRHYKNNQYQHHGSSYYQQNRRGSKGEVPGPGLAYKSREFRDIRNRQEYEPMNNYDNVKKFSSVFRHPQHQSPKRQKTRHDSSAYKYSSYSKSRSSGSRSRSSSDDSNSRSRSRSRSPNSSSSHSYSAKKKSKNRKVDRQAVVAKDESSDYYDKLVNILQDQAANNNSSFIQRKSLPHSQPYKQQLPIREKIVAVDPRSGGKKDRKNNN